MNYALKLVAIFAWLRGIPKTIRMDLESINPVKLDVMVRSKRSMFILAAFQHSYKILILSLILGFSGQKAAIAQCALQVSGGLPNTNTTEPTTGTCVDGVILDLNLDFNGQAVIDGNSLTGIIDPVTPGGNCQVYNFYDWDGTFLGNSVPFDCLDAISTGCGPIAPPPGCIPPVPGPVPGPASRVYFVSISDGVNLGPPYAAVWIREIKDINPPVVNCPNDVTFTATCSFGVISPSTPVFIPGLQLDPADITDNCTIDVALSFYEIIPPVGCGLPILGVPGDLDPANNPFVPDVTETFDLGVSMLVYHVFDACGNTARCTTKVTVTMEKPSAVCEVGFTTNIPSVPGFPGAILTLPAITFDGGSYDECYGGGFFGGPGGPFPGGRILDLDPFLASGRWVYEVTRTPAVPFHGDLT